jgi:hypothetical protein
MHISIKDFDFYSTFFGNIRAEIYFQSSSRRMVLEVSAPPSCNMIWYSKVAVTASTPEDEAVKILTRRLRQKAKREGWSKR